MKNFLKNTNKISLGIIAVLLAGFIFYGGFQLGQEYETVDLINEEEVSNNSDLEDDFSLFWDSVEIVKEKYYKPEDIEDRKLLNGAIKGMIGSLEDPYSSFFNPEDAQKFTEDVSGSFGGIGAEIGTRDGQLVVVSPLKGNPAEEAGLKSGDEIMKVDDTVTSNLSVDESVKLIRGEKGTVVELLINRDSWDEPRTIEIERAEIKVPTLDWEMKDGKIAYIQLYSFNANAPEEFYNASLEALLKGANGLVFDLRGNSGGYLNAATNISGWFLDKGDVVVKEKFRTGETQPLTANGNSAWSNVPVVVLVDGGSASASEIVAGALRDHLGIPLVGQTTFGKGTVQQVESLSDGSKIKISVAEWVTPDGHQINEEGLTPDHEIELSEEDVENEEDPQLDKALEIIREKAESNNTIRKIIL